MTYLLISSLVLMVSFRLFDRAAGIADVRKTNMMGVVFYFTFFAQSWIAGVLVVNGLDDHYMLARLVHQDSRLMGWMAINYAMLAFPLGMLLANTAWRREPGAKQLYHQFLAAPTQPSFSRSDRALELLLIIGLGVGTAATAYTLAQVGFVGIYELVVSAGSEEELRVLRNQAKWGFTGIVYIRNFLMVMLVPLLACVALAHHLRRRTLLSFILVFAYVVLATVALTYSFEKAPLLYFIFSLGFVYLYFSGGVSWQTVFWGTLAVCGLLVLMYTLLTLATVTFGYNTGPIGRILLSQSVGTFLSFDYFGRIGDHIGLSSVSRLLSDVFNLGYSERSARVLMTFYNPAGVEAGTSGVISSLFIAEAWANFGLLGVVLAPVYVGFLLQTLFLLMVTLRKSTVTVAVFGYFSFNNALGGGLNAYFYDPGMIVLLGFLLTGWVLVKFLVAVGGRRACA